MNECVEADPTRYELIREFANRLDNLKVDDPADICPPKEVIEDALLDPFSLDARSRGEYVRRYVMAHLGLEVCEIPVCENDCKEKLLSLAHSIKGY